MKHDKLSIQAISMERNKAMKMIFFIFALMFMAHTACAQSCPDDNHPHAIDLGLPSGTKWACCNVGATTPEENGGYYAWGETEEKELYDISTYIYGNIYDSASLIGDNICGTEYDVAHVKWGGEWQMPPEDKAMELRAQCSFEWVSINGVSGGKFVGPNGNSIFFPASGSYDFTGLEECGSGGVCWTGTKHRIINEAYCFGLYNEGTSVHWCDRYLGFTVRPVTGGMDMVPLLLSPDSLLLSEFDEATVEITSGYEYYTVESSNTDVASAVDYEGEKGFFVEVKTFFAGEATIKVRDKRSGQESEIKVTVVSNCPDDNHPHAIDLGLPSGTKWACCNVGATSPRQKGGYYAWGETEEKNLYDYSTYIHCDGSWDTCHDLGDCISGTEHDVAHVKWGGEWQMPSLEQMTELLHSRLYIWEVEDVDNYDVGVIIKAKNNNYIFMPVTGWFQGDGFQNPKDASSYWLGTKSRNESNGAYNIAFGWYLSGFQIDDYYFNSRAMGHAVRPVLNTPNSIDNPESARFNSKTEIYNIYGVKLADNLENLKILQPGIYIVNGKKIVVK